MEEEPSSQIQLNFILSEGEKHINSYNRVIFRTLGNLFSIKKTWMGYILRLFLKLFPLGVVFFSSADHRESENTKMFHSQQKL